MWLMGGQKVVVWLGRDEEDVGRKRAGVDGAK
jgi:hypothetical protein